MWTPEEQLMLATLSRGQRELMIQARTLEKADNPHVGNDVGEIDAREIEASAAHRAFLRQVDELVFNGDMPLAEKQRLLYTLYCRCCGMFGGASTVFANAPERG